MIACREILDFLMDYLDGNLSSAQRAVFEEHLAVCPSCVAYMHNYRCTEKLATALGEGACPPEGAEELIHSILHVDPHPSTPTT